MLLARNPVGMRSRVRGPGGAVARLRLRVMAVHGRRRRAAGLHHYRRGRTARLLDHHRRGRYNNGGRRHNNRCRRYRSPDGNVHMNSGFSLPGGNHNKYHACGGKQIFHYFLHHNRNGLLYR